MDDSPEIKSNLRKDLSIDYEHANKDKQANWFGGPEFLGDAGVDCGDKAMKSRTDLERYDICCVIPN